MKSKKLAQASAVVLLIGIGFVLKPILFGNPLDGILEKEWLEQRFPEKVDTEDSIWQVLPYGYTLGPWPSHFHGEPIVTKLTYSKGPPQKFLHSITQLWQPVEAEVTLFGPKTLIENKALNDWKTCFERRLGCNSEKDAILAYAGKGKNKNSLKKATWFDHLELNGPRGVHLYWEFEKYRIDDFILFTSTGISQGFEVKTARNPIGQDALSLFYQTLSSLRLSDELSNGRDWIQNKIKSVNLASVKKIQDPKQRLQKYIEIQNWLFSLLSVDPTKSTPFFHLAGVTHLLNLDLIRLQDKFFEHQESWILSAKPNLENLYRYSKDFQEPEVTKQIEALFQDVLFQQQKATSLLKK